MVKELAMNDAFDNPRQSRTKGSFQPRMAWVPPNMDGDFVGHLLPPSIAPRMEFAQHYSKGTGGKVCETCSTKGWNYCPVYKGLVARAEAQGKETKMLRPSTRIVVPFYGVKTYRHKESGELRSMKPAFHGIELPYGAYYNILKSKDVALGVNCKSCGGRRCVENVKYVCNVCTTELSWPVSEQKENKKPVCPRCRKVSPFREVVRCSKCSDPKRLTVFDTQVTISKLVDGTIDFDFELSPVVPLPEEALAGPPFTMASLVTFDPEDEILAAFGLAGNAKEDIPAPPAEVKTNIADEDSIPF